MISSMRSRTIARMIQKTIQPVATARSEGAGARSMRFLRSAQGGGSWRGCELGGQSGDQFLDERRRGLDGGMHGGGHLERVGVRGIGWAAVASDEEDASAACLHQGERAQDGQGVEGVGF